MHLVSGFPAEKVHKSFFRREPFRGLGEGVCRASRYLKRFFRGPKSSSAQFEKSGSVLRRTLLCLACTMAKYT